jgi:hypothetical protein
MVFCFLMIVIEEDFGSIEFYRTIWVASSEEIDQSNPP